MTDLADRVAWPWLWFLTDWSLRWGIIIGALALVLAVRPWRRASTRHAFCISALITGILLPFVPRWGVVGLPWPMMPQVARVPSKPPPDAAPTHGQTSSPAPPPLDQATDQRAANSRLPVAPEGGTVAVARPSVMIILPLTLAGAWAIGVIALLVRFIGAQLFLGRLKRRSSAIVDISSLGLLEDCRRALRLGRPVRLATDPTVASPAVVGCWVPLILVPPDWNSWTMSDRRACLLHELAHVARYDDWTKFAQEIVRIPVFFHPLVAWLLARLDLERELLCDEAAVTLGTDPVAYSRLLLGLARRPGRLHPEPGPIRPDWLPFLDRGTVAARIGRLLEDGMPWTLADRTPRRLAALSLAALAAMLLIGTARLRPAVARPQPSSQASEATTNSPPAPANQTPAKVAADEVAGTVVDKDGRPIEGVEADAWHWAPGNVTFTDKDGRFRFGNLPETKGIPVRFRKDGYATQFQLDREAGVPDWVVVLENSSYMEGRVLAPNGSPVPNALLRADSGPRKAKGFRLSECIIEATSGPDGRYRLYAEPSSYDISVRVPGTGVARLNETIAADQTKTVDVRLEPGVAFEAKAVDAQTGHPLAGLRIWHWQKPGIEGTSDNEGRILITDVPPGKYPRFQIDGESLGYRRWWSDDALSEWSRYQKAANFGFQRNFDGLDFDVKPGMGAVTIKLERGAKVRGRVLDPDGKPVVGATVAPAKTGSGNSLTGDTRFTAETDAEGRFEALLPASGEVSYNLVAHDGKFRQWRTWANGVSPPLKTTPGQVIEGIDLSLSRPCTVIGRVVDAEDRPVADREVRAEPTSKDENRYFDPTTKTGPDGTFTLRFVRPGEHYIQVAPFWLSAEKAPSGTSQVVMLEAGKEVRDLELRATPAR